MKKYLVVFLFGVCVQLASAQSTHDIMVGSGLDLIKTDNYGPLKKGQVGMEVNYFVVRHFSVSGGLEIWTNQQNSFVMGMRWYADDHLFARFRGLIGVNDASLGVGWSQPINPNWRVEAI